MSKYLVDDSSLTSVADAIRSKADTSDNLSFPTGFVSAINNISTGGGDIDACAVSVESSNANVVGNVVNLVTAISITAEDYTI